MLTSAVRFQGRFSVNGNGGRAFDDKIKEIQSNAKLWFSSDDLPGYTESVDTMGDPRKLKFILTDDDCLEFVNRLNTALANDCNRPGIPVTPNETRQTLEANMKQFFPPELTETMRKMFEANTPFQKLSPVDQQLVQEHNDKSSSCNEAFNSLISDRFKSVYIEV